MQQQLVNCHLSAEKGEFGGIHDKCFEMILFILSLNSKMVDRLEFYHYGFVLDCLIWKHVSRSYQKRAALNVMHSDVFKKIF